MPNFSELTMANSRHSACTEHSRQIDFANDADFAIDMQIKLTGLNDTDLVAANFETVIVAT